MTAIEKLKTQNRWEGKGNHCCEGGNTFISTILPFLFFFAFTATFGQPDISQRRSEKEVTIWLQVQVAESFDIGIQKIVPRLNKCLDKGGDYVEK